GIRKPRIGQDPVKLRQYRPSFSFRMKSGGHVQNLHGPFPSFRILYLYTCAPWKLFTKSVCGIQYLTHAGDWATSSSRLRMAASGVSRNRRKSGFHSRRRAHPRKPLPDVSRREAADERTPPRSGRGSTQRWVLGSGNRSRKKRREPSH